MGTLPQAQEQVQRRWVLMVSMACILLYIGIGIGVYGFGLGTWVLYTYMGPGIESNRVESHAYTTPAQRNGAPSRPPTSRWYVNT